MNFTTQIHDFNPGFGRPVDARGDLVFWTVAIPDDDVQVHFEAARAELDVDHLHLRDYGNIPNALGPVATTRFDPATVSFDVVWTRPVTDRVHVRHGTLGNVFSGDYKEYQATVTWSARNTATGFRFTSDPGDFSTSVDAFAELGRERNGTFAREGGDDPGPPAPPGDGGGAGASRDQAFAALVLAGANGATHPLSAGGALGGTGLALRDSRNDPVSVAGGRLPTGDLTGGSAGRPAGHTATAVVRARGHALELVADPEARGPVTDIGPPGGDILFRQERCPA
jgi:hypothetical protein